MNLGLRQPAAANRGMSYPIKARRQDLKTAVAAAIQCPESLTDPLRVQGIAARLSESIYIRVLAALRGGSEHNMPNLSEKQIRKARPHFRRAVSEGVEVVLCGYSCPDDGWVGWVERAGNAAALRWIAFADGVPDAIQTGKRLLQRAGFLAFPLVATWCMALRTSISER